MQPKRSSTPPCSAVWLTDTLSVCRQPHTFHVTEPALALHTFAAAKMSFTALQLYPPNYSAVWALHILLTCKKAHIYRCTHAHKQTCTHCTHTHRHVDAHLLSADLLKLIDENPLFFTIVLPAGRGWRRVGLVQKWWWLMPRPACRNTSQYHSNYHSTNVPQ